MAMVRGLPWTVKYRPRLVNEVVGNRKAKKEFMDWLKPWLMGRVGERKAAFLYGPPGVGKTALVEAAANQLGLELVELNAGEIESIEQVRRVTSLARSHGSLFGRVKRLIFFDEVDNISASVASSIINEIVKMIKVSENPVVLAANDAWLDKLRPLRSEDVSILIRFYKVSSREIAERLAYICRAERLSCDRNALMRIAERNDGDVRSSILDLQLVASLVGRRITEDSVKSLAGFGYRDREIDVFKALGRIFYARQIGAAVMAVNQFTYEPDLLLRWIAENIPNIYKDPEELFSAYEALSLADLYKARSNKPGYWRLERYSRLFMSAGVSLSKKRWPKGSRFKYPRYLRELVASRRVRELRSKILAKLSRRLHASQRKIISEYLPYLAFLFNHDEKFAERLSRILRLSKEEVEHLRLLGRLYTVE